MSFRHAESPGWFEQQCCSRQRRINDRSAIDFGQREHWYNGIRCWYGGSAGLDHGRGANAEGKE